MTGRPSGQQTGCRAVERGHVVSNVTVAAALPAVDQQQAQHEQGDVEHLAQMRHDRLCL